METEHLEHGAGPLRPSKSPGEPAPPALDPEEHHDLVIDEGDADAPDSLNASLRQEFPEEEAAEGVEVQVEETVEEAVGEEVAAPVTRERRSSSESVRVEAVRVITSFP